MGIRQSIDPDQGVVRLIDDLLSRAVALRASDVHFEPTDNGMRVRFRIDGRLHDAETLPLMLRDNVVARLKVIAGLLTYRIDIPQEGGLVLTGTPPVDARVATFPTIRGERVVIRLLASGTSSRELDSLGLRPSHVEQLDRVTQATQGLVLTTGPAGAGKTTTLYALLRRIIATRPDVSVITVEDPVEFRMDGIAQVQINSAGGMDFARSLRSLVRQDPQVILLGEIRDAETARVVAEAALTGHLILSSLHAGRATEAVVRLIEMGVPPYQLTSMMRLVVCQRLVRTICSACNGSHCDAEGVLSPEQCAQCMGVGFHGRIAFAEMLRFGSGLRAAVLERGDVNMLERAWSRDDPDRIDLEKDADRHVLAGVTTQNEVRESLAAGFGL